MPSLINHFYRFGDFAIDADQLVLLRHGQPLLLAPKVLETLLTLVQNSGRIVEKEEVMKRLWPDMRRGVAAVLRGSTMDRLRQLFHLVAESSEISRTVAGSANTLDNIAAKFP